MRFILLISCFFSLSFYPNFSLARDKANHNVNNPAIKITKFKPIDNPALILSSSSQPIQPIVPKKKAKNRLKMGKSRPNWDIFWLFGGIIGLGLYPISLSLYLLGLALTSAVLSWLGFGLLTVLFLSLAFLFVTLKRNKSTADRFFEKYSLLLLAAGIFLAALGTFIIALLLPVLWIWIVGLLICLVSGLLLFLGWKNRKIY